MGASNRNGLHSCEGEFNLERKTHTHTHMQAWWKRSTHTYTLRLEELTPHLLKPAVATCCRQQRGHHVNLQPADKARVGRYMAFFKKHSAGCRPNPKEKVLSNMLIQNCRKQHRCPHSEPNRKSPSQRRPSTSEHVCFLR